MVDLLADFLESGVEVVEVMRPAIDRIGLTGEGNPHGEGMAMQALERRRTVRRVEGEFLEGFYGGLPLQTTRRRTSKSWNRPPERALS